MVKDTHLVKPPIPVEILVKIGPYPTKVQRLPRHSKLCCRSLSDVTIHIQRVVMGEVIEREGQMGPGVNYEGAGNIQMIGTSIPEIHHQAVWSHPRATVASSCHYP